MSSRVAPRVPVQMELQLRRGIGADVAPPDRFAAGERAGGDDRASRRCRSWHCAEIALRPAADRSAERLICCASTCDTDEKQHDDIPLRPGSSLRAFYNRFFAQEAGCRFVSCSSVWDPLALPSLASSNGGARLSNRRSSRHRPVEDGQRRRRRARARPPDARQGHRRHRQDDSGHQAGRGGALHRLDAQAGTPAVRGSAEATRADRHDDRRGGVRGSTKRAPGQAARPGGRAGRRSPSSALASTPAS